jgi:hypothetical protein
LTSPISSVPEGRHSSSRDHGLSLSFKSRLSTLYSRRALPARPPESVPPPPLFPKPHRGERIPPSRTTLTFLLFTLSFCILHFDFSIPPPPACSFRSLCALCEHCVRPSSPCPPPLGFSNLDFRFSIFQPPCGSAQAGSRMRDPSLHPPTTCLDTSPLSSPLISVLSVTPW